MEVVNSVDLDIVAIFAALGNKTRYEIVRVLQNKDIGTCCNRIEVYENGVCVGDVVKLTGLAQSTISQHLSVLEKAGVIRREKRDLWTCYFLNNEVINKFLETVNRELSIR